MQQPKPVVVVALALVLTMWGSSKSEASEPRPPQSLTLAEASPDSPMGTIPTTTTFYDKVGPVTLEYRVDGVTVATEKPASSPFTKSVSVTCNKYSIIEVVASDAAGHSTTSSMRVGCDGIHPAIGVLDSDYKPESEGTATTAVSFAPKQGDPVKIFPTQTPPTLTKYRHTYCSGCTNMPKLRFTATDSGEVSTSLSDLVVQYRYLDQATESAGWTERRAWTALTPSASYELELSDTVLAASILHTTPATLHRLEVRVTDKAGNVSKLDYTFRLLIKPVPIIMSDCQLAEDLTRNNLREKTLQKSFGGFDLGVLKAKLYWPAGSVPAPLKVVPGGAISRANITELRDSIRQVSEWRDVPADSFSLPSAHTPPTYWLTGADTGLTGPGLYPDGAVYFDRSKCEPSCAWWPNNQEASPMSYEIDGVVASDLAPARLEANRQYSVEVLAKRARFFVRGSEFGWTPDVQGYTYANGSGQECSSKHSEQTTCAYQDCHEECRERACEIEIGERPPCYDCQEVCECTDWYYDQFYSLRDFQLLRYVSAFSVDVAPLTLSAEDPAFPETKPEVIFYGSTCDKAFRYLTTVTGETVTNY